MSPGKNTRSKKASSMQSKDGFNVVQHTPSKSAVVTEVPVDDLMTLSGGNEQQGGVSGREVGRPVTFAASDENGSVTIERVETNAPSCSVMSSENMPTSTNSLAMEALFKQLAEEFQHKLRTLFDGAVASTTAQAMLSPGEWQNQVNSESVRRHPQQMIEQRASVAPSNHNVPQHVTNAHDLSHVGHSNAGPTDGQSVPHVTQSASFIPTPMGSVTSVVHSYDHRKLLELPKFAGDPSEWPMFERSFIDSTSEFRYSDTRNIIRLRQALEGEARSTVISLLPFPESVKEIIETLKENFGRPELIINSQLSVIRKLPQLQSGNLNAVVKFSTAIANMTALMKYARADHRLCDATLLAELVGKMPPEMQLDWAEFKEKIPAYATLEDFSVFLKKIAKRANAVKDSLPKAELPKWQQSQHSKAPTKGHIFIANKQEGGCVICKGSCEKIADCKAFKEMTVEDRWVKVKSCQLCFSCLKAGHSLARCYKKKKCQIDECEKQHHSLLHNKRPVVENSNGVAFSGKAEVADSNVWFQIVPVNVSANGKQVRTYAFIDTGASHSMIDWDLAEKLNLCGEKDVLCMQWLSNIKTEQPSERVTFEICGLDQNCVAAKISRVHTVRHLNMPKQTVDVNIYDKKSKQRLTVSYRDAQPEIIIGLDNIHLTTPLDRPIAVHKTGLVAIRTRLGSIIYGKGDKHTNTRQQVFSACCVRNKLSSMEKMMAEYFKNDDLGTVAREQNGMSVEDLRILEVMKKNTIYKDGRYEVRLLWKTNEATLPFNFGMALRRFEVVQRKMKQDQQFAQQYQQKIEDYIQKGYARELTKEEAEKTTARTFYLPHFAVMNPNKAGIRVVFDAAAEINGCSLNSQLLAGPDLNKSLLAVIMKFREAPIAICGDIREMFLQVLVKKEDQDSQRFLWHDGNEIRTYVMARMIFGATCSPTLAQFVKNLNARKYEQQYPRAVEAIIERHYVDDYVDCFKDEDEAVKVVQQVISIHNSGGFVLRNFASNSEALLQSIGGDLKDRKIVSLDGHCVERVLGMHWDCVSDTFVFRLKFHKARKEVLELTCRPTKRETLSVVMSLFDPFGLLANLTITGKLLMQQLWIKGVKWDEKLPDDQFAVWQSWMRMLACVEQVKVPRCFANSIASSSDIQLHMFADASKYAVAAVAYFRIVVAKEVSIRFVYAKTRCAPIKYRSIPRLELQAAVIAVRLKEIIMENSGVKVNRCCFWTDSTTVLSWINSDNRRHKPYEANRLGEIIECSNASEWRWVPTKDNAADDGTRIGQSYSPDNRWINGPQFLLSKEESWPKRLSVSMMATEADEEQSLVLVMTKVPKLWRYERFSCYSRLKRTAAWVLRYFNNLQSKITGAQLLMGPLSADELNGAEISLCVWVQKEMFIDEYNCLQSKQLIDSKSSLLKLNPIIDEEGVMRLVGRIDRASCLSLEERRPIILPKQHKLTTLIVRYYHIKFRHQNRNTVIAEIRRKFWIPSIRVVMKAVESNCNYCKIRKATPQQPMMGLLPMDRVTPYVRPFSYCGVDFFGPLTVTVRRQHEKRWVALFTCLTIRAVHLELVSNLSSDACLLAIRNFINRRGIPQHMRSDNGTNFVGIHKELDKVYDFVDHAAIGNSVSNLGIDWKFNCPADPSAGGAWERLVQSVKKVMLVILQESAPRTDTLNSIIIEVENIVNSRPLTHLPVANEEEEPLTPNHFLLNCANSTQTPSDDGIKNICLRKQWRVAQNIKNAFWKRWIREYLPELTRRTKWCRPTEALKEGDLVLVCDATLPRSAWRRGLISKLNRGPDGVARTAEIKTMFNTMKRPVSKLAKLDISEN